jgi:hypothetical protein
VSSPAIVTWLTGRAWFSDARDADAVADVLRRSSPSVTVRVVAWGPDEEDEARARCDELEGAVEAAIEALDVGDAEVSQQAVKDALEALQETRP